MIYFVLLSRATLISGNNAAITSTKFVDSHSNRLPPLWQHSIGSISVNILVFFIVFPHSYPKDPMFPLISMHDIYTGVGPCTDEKTIFIYIVSRSSSSSIFYRGCRDFEWCTNKLRLLSGKIMKLIRELGIHGVIVNTNFLAQWEFIEGKSFFF